MRPILFVDNHDSFVWNLVDYVSVFYDNTIVLPNEISLEEVERLKPRGIVISPGRAIRPGPGTSATAWISSSAIPILPSWGYAWAIRP